MLDQSLVKAAKPRAQSYKMFDEGGLFLFVAPSGLKSWRFKYIRGGKEQLKVLGRVPDMSLHRARILRDEMRAAISAGKDPANAMNENADRFEDVARRWHDHQLDGWSKTHADDVLASLERDVFPSIGNFSVSAIDAPALLALLQGIERRGHHELARRMRQRFGAIFGFAKALGLVDEDPSAALGHALKGVGLVQPHPALIDSASCRQLLADADAATDDRIVRAASRFLALTAVRWSALREAQWHEIEDLDGDAPIWRIPAARMKLVRAKKQEARFDHVIPLSAGAVNILSELREQFAFSANEGARASGDALIFSRNGSAPLGENALSQLYIAAGYRGRHVPHGWRASFSTILNLDLGRDYNADIDEALAHQRKGKVEAAYNRASMLARRRVIFDRWSDLLSGVT